MPSCELPLSACVNTMLIGGTVVVVILVVVVWLDAVLNHNRAGGADAGTFMARVPPFHGEIRPAAGSRSSHSCTRIMCLHPSTAPMAVCSSDRPSSTLTDGTSPPWCTASVVRARARDRHSPGSPSYSAVPLVTQTPPPRGPVHPLGTQVVVVENVIPGAAP